MRSEEKLEIEVTRKICDAVGGQAEVAKHMGKTRQYVQQMLSDKANNKFNLGQFLEAFEKMNVNKVLGQKIAHYADLLTKYRMIQTKGK